MKHQLHLCVLVIEDYILDFELVKDMLESYDFEILNATTLKHSKEQINNHKIDVILLDLNLPDSKGMTTFEQVKQLTPNTPVIIVTGHGETELGINAVKNGAQDFLLKNELDEDKLYRSISYAIERNNMRLELLNAKKRIEEQKNDLKEQQEKLVSAKISAERANRAKSDFLANMSHEIRTPLNAILGLSEILSSMTKDPQLLNYIKTINTSGKSLLTIVNDILDLSKLESGKIEISSEPINVKNLLNEMKTIFDVKIQEKDLKMTIDIDKSLPDLVVLDEKRLRQILFNMIGNAIKFTHSGSVNISIKVNSTKKKNSIIDFTLSISDTGIGIEEDFLKNIYDAFVQFGNVESKSFQGTGLGLAITYRLVTMMNGKIDVKSQVNIGTTFDITFQNIPYSQYEKAHEKLSKNKFQSVSFSGKKILVVDDIRVNRMVAKEHLRHVKCDVIEAENGEQAISMAVQDRPDIILMDMNMPVMNGVVATRIIKQKSTTKHIPVISLSASDPEEDNQNNLFDGFLSKPIKVPKLFELLSDFLGKEINTNICTSDTIVDKKEGQFIEDKFSIQTTELLKKWEKVLSQQYIPDIEEFINDIKDFAESINNSELLTYCEELTLHLDNFDIDHLKKSLSQFSKIINEVHTNN